MELIHRNLLIGIHDALQETFFQEKKYADKVIERLLKAHRKWGSQDRQTVSEIFYNIIRWKKRLEYYMGEGVKPNNIYKIHIIYIINNYKIANVLYDKNKIDNIIKNFFFVNGESL